MGVRVIFKGVFCLSAGACLTGAGGEGTWEAACDH